MILMLICLNVTGYCCLISQSLKRNLFSSRTLFLMQWRISCGWISSQGFRKVYFSVLFLVSLDLQLVRRQRQDFLPKSLSCGVTGEMARIWVSFVECPNHSCAVSGFLCQLEMTLFQQMPPEVGPVLSCLLVRTSAEGLGGDHHMAITSAVCSFCQVSWELPSTFNTADLDKLPADSLAVEMPHLSAGLVSCSEGSANMVLCQGVSNCLYLWQ